MGDDREELVRLLGRLAFDMQGLPDAESTLTLIVEGAVRLVPGARWAGISEITGKAVQARVPSDPIVATLDALQSELDEGPCVSALREHHTVLIDDMTAESRFPRFAAAALELGVRSMLSFQLFVRRENLGALNLYASEASVFDDESEVIGSVLAQHASVAMAASATDAQWRQAIDTRDVIGQAKGLLMQRNGVSGMHAFNMLVKVSQDGNMKLADIARWLVEQHESTAAAAPSPP
jgi:GAF domain-containing protein